MNIIYIGYRKWSYKILKNLLAKKNPQFKLKAIITTPDREADFERLGKNCLIIDPKAIGNDKNLQIITSLKPDILLIYGWSWMLPPQLYNNHLCLILHTSPLPKYRGGSPLQHQIMAGEEKSAVTIFKAGVGIDTGDIYSQTSFSLSGSIDQIFNRIIRVGSKDTIKVIKGITKNNLFPTPQDNKKATVFKRRKSSESELTTEDFKTKTAEELYNFIRALEDPYPNAYMVCKDGKKIFFTGVKLKNED